MWVTSVEATETTMKHMLAGVVHMHLRIQRLIMGGASMHIGQAAIGLLHLAKALRQAFARRRKIGMMAFGEPSIRRPKIGG